VWKLIQIFRGKTLASCAVLVACGAEVYCPVKKERKRIRSTRGKIVIVDAPAYHGWAFMKGFPDPSALAFHSDVRFKIIEGSAACFSDDQIDQIREDERRWNAQHSFPDGRKPFVEGERVVVCGGLLKGRDVVVVKDQGSIVLIDTGDENIFSVIKINPFLLDRFGA
jgi:hypothetical protein